MLKFCKKCRENKSDKPFNGYYPFLYDNDYECPTCKSKLIDTGIDESEYINIAKISKDINFLEAMIKLKQKDIIKFQSRMFQFKTQLAQQENNNAQNDNKPRCPKCGSTNIQIVPRKWSLLTGFLTNKTDRVCVNCKHKF